MKGGSRQSRFEKYLEGLEGEGVSYGHQLKFLSPSKITNCIYL